jgi:ParB-like nuclease domain
MNIYTDVPTPEKRLRMKTLSIWSVEWLPTIQIKPFERNPRKISDRAIEVVGDSIEENGWQQPIVTDKNYVIIVGHVRWHAAKKRGIEFVPVHVADDLTPAQVKVYRIMDNRSHEETGWDLDLLKLEITDIAALNFDLKFTGFEPRQLEELLVSTDAAADDAANQAPPRPTQPVSRLGDLWQCGLNRVLHGDATNREHVSRVQGDLRPLILITDPPYGVKVDPMWREEAGLGSPVQTGKVTNDDRVDWSDAFRLFPGDIGYIWHAGIHSGPVAAGLQDVGFRDSRADHLDQTALRFE